MLQLVMIKELNFPPRLLEQLSTGLFLLMADSTYLHCGSMILIKCRKSG